MKKVSKIDKVLLALIILFSIFGLIMVLSASSMESYMRYDKSPYYYFIRQLIFVGVGFVIYFILHIIPLSFYKKLSSVFIYMIILVMIALIIYGKSTREVVSWFKIGPIKIQPSEFAKLFSIIYLSSYYGKYKDNLDDYWIIIKPLIPIIIICILVALQPDLGTASIIALISFSIFCLAPIPKQNRKMFNKIIEEWGYLVGIAIIMGYLIILYRIFKIAKKSKRASSSLMAFGIFSYITIHIVVNLGGVTGLLPLTGVPLPFLSYGGSFTLTLFTALGIVQAISIENAKDILKKNTV